MIAFVEPVPLRRGVAGAAPDGEGDDVTERSSGSLQIGVLVLVGLVLAAVVLAVLDLRAGAALCGGLAVAVGGTLALTRALSSSRR